MACNNNDRENRRHHSGCMRMARGTWGGYPYYGGPCPDAYGCYGRRPWDDNDDDDTEGADRDDHGRRGRRRRRRRGGDANAMFITSAPVAISPNGIVPLTMVDACRDSQFDVNSGMITLESEGTYLATYTVRVPAGTTLDTLMTLNLNDASLSPAITQVTTDGGATTLSYTAQAIFQADEGDTVTLRTSEAINVTDTATQPLFTLSLVKLGN